MLATKLAFCDNSKWRIYVNNTKSNVLHFRRKNVDRSVFQFRIGDMPLNYSDKYKYLGVVLNEFLDYSVTANMISEVATRALGSLNTKFKC